MSDYKKENSVYKYFFVIFLLIILIGIEFYFHISYVCITEESIVLSFVGILATFIVVSNYAQVKSIEESTRNEIEKFKKEISELTIRQKQEFYDLSYENIKIEIGLFEADFENKKKEDIEKFFDKMNVYLEESNNKNIHSRIINFCTNILRTDNSDVLNLICFRIDNIFTSHLSVKNHTEEVFSLLNSLKNAICVNFKKNNITNVEYLLFCLNRIAYVSEDRDCKLITEKARNIYDDLLKIYEGEKLAFVKFWYEKFGERDARWGFPVYDKTIDDWVSGLKRNI